MYSHMLQEMADRLVEDGVIVKKKRGEALSSLSSYWADKIALVWTTSDVTDAHESLTDEQAAEVLRGVLRNHDCTLGVTWDTIDSAVRELFRKEGEGE